MHVFISAVTTILLTLGTASLDRLVDRTFIGEAVDQVSTDGAPAEDESKSLAIHTDVI